jgi:hypothetical protein
MFIQIHNANDTAHSDQTGCFPVTASSGNKYIMVLVEVDGNFIDAEPMKNKTAGSMIKAYLALWKQLTASGTAKPITHLLDKKASEEFKAEIRKKGTIQLVPPDNHKQNLAERAIKTFKNHLKAILAGVDDGFPMRLWDKLLSQTILTLNLLCQSNVAPTVAAWQYIHVPFDYKKMPLAPMGCAVQIHKSSERQETWAANTINGWYLPTSPEHHQCHRTYVKKTKSERISDTVFFKHRYSTQPTVTPADTIIKALGDLTQALKGRRNLKGIEQIKALSKIDELLNNILTTNKAPTRKVTFDEATKPPQEVQTAPRVNNISKSVKERTGINIAIIDKPLTINTPPPRVETSADKTSILNMPPPRVVEPPKADREKIMLNQNRIKF